MSAVRLPNAPEFKSAILTKTIPGHLSEEEAQRIAEESGMIFYTTNHTTSYDMQRGNFPITEINQYRSN